MLHVLLYSPLRSSLRCPPRPLATCHPYPYPYPPPLDSSRPPAPGHSDIATFEKQLERSSGFQRFCSPVSTTDAACRSPDSIATVLAAAGKDASLLSKADVYNGLQLVAQFGLLGFVDVFFSVDNLASNRTSRSCSPASRSREDRPSQAKRRDFPSRARFSVVAPTVKF